MGKAGLVKKEGADRPALRPYRLKTGDEIASLFSEAIQRGDGLIGAHCVHEHWMRGAMAVHIESMLGVLWKSCSSSVPDWLPMRHIEWLPLAYDVCGRFERGGRGRFNVYLVLLDYSDSRADPYGVYVGMSKYAPALRFDQHKAGIRAAGSVLKRGLEPLIGPVLHLQNIKRADAERIEEGLAEALRAEGLLVQGGH